MKGLLNINRSPIFPIGPDEGGGAVDSVNGQTGVVVLDTDDIAEGAINEYYTEARFGASLATKTTDDLTEGAVNKYRLFDNLVAVADPTPDNDNTEGYEAGSTWLNATGGKFWKAVSVGAGVAVWRPISFNVISSGTTVVANDTETVLATITQVDGKTYEPIISIETNPDVQMYDGRYDTSSGFANNIIFSLDWQTDGTSDLTTIFDQGGMMAGDLSIRHLIIEYDL